MTKWQDLHILNKTNFTMKGWTDDFDKRISILTKSKSTMGGFLKKKSTCPLRRCESFKCKKNSYFSLCFCLWLWPHTYIAEAPPFILDRMFILLVDVSGCPVREHLLVSWAPDPKVQRFNSLFQFTQSNTIFYCFSFYLCHSSGHSIIFTGDYFPSSGSHITRPKVGPESEYRTWQMIAG